VTVLAAWIAVALMLALPSLAAADHPGADSEPVIGLQHMREHAKLWRAHENARAEWRGMTRAERRRAVRRERRVARREYTRASAAAGKPRAVGRWGRPFVMTSNYRGYAIHAAMLHTGKVLMWGYPIHPDQPAFRGNESYAWLWDPALGRGANAVRDVTPVVNGENVSIYCSGMSFLPDGRVLLVGGTLIWPEEDPNDAFDDFAGLNQAIIFDPATETWTDLPRPDGSHGRWYPTQVLLPDGRTLVVSGLREDAPGGVVNEGHEMYDARSNTFTLLESPLQQRIVELYPHLFVMPDGKVLLAGPDPRDSAIFDPGDLADPWMSLPWLAKERIGGNAALLPEGPRGSTKVAAIAGRTTDRRPWAENEMIDLDDRTPSWYPFPSLHVRRSYPNTVVLPDRSMVTIGGDDHIANSAERAVELYDPATSTWRLGPKQVEMRAYHSTALLLPDGRVLSAGDDYFPTSNGDRSGSSPHDTGEIYSPPYLFKGPRPVISFAPGAVRWNVPFGVGAAGDIDDAVLMAPAAVTHANDMNARHVPLRVVARHSGGITLKSPPSANVAPPGWYMLFLLNNGVPSVAKWVHLDRAAPAVAAMPPGASPDRSGPALGVRFAKRGSLGRLRRTGRLRVRIELDERANVKMRLMRGKRRVALKRTWVEDGTNRLTLRPRRRVIRWLRDTRAPRLRLAVVASDRAGNETALSRRLRR
jgi:hypothetical protein